MNKTNRAASRVTTTDNPAMVGYSGPVDMVRYHRSWWRRRGTEDDPAERVVAAIDRTVEWIYQANGVERESP